MYVCVRCVCVVCVCVCVCVCRARRFECEGSGACLYERMYARTCKLMCMYVCTRVCLHSCAVSSHADECACVQADTSTHFNKLLGHAGSDTDSFLVAVFCSRHVAGKQMHASLLEVLPP